MLNIRQCHQLISDLTCSGKSLIYIKKRMGPRTEPWGTPDVTGEGGDSSPTTTVCCRIPNKVLIQLRVCPLTPYRCSLYRIFWSLTLSKALLKSRNKTSVCLPDYKFLLRSSISMNNWVSLDRFSWNPYWRS